MASCLFPGSDSQESGETAIVIGEPMSGSWELYLYLIICLDIIYLVYFSITLFAILEVSTVLPPECLIMKLVVPA